MQCAILYADNHVIVIHKPPMLLTQPNGTGASSAEEEVKAWVKKEYRKRGNIFLHVIHRIDKPVSGLVLFAKTGKALSRLQSLMREKKIKKTYVALVSPPPDCPSATLVHWLRHGDYQACLSSAQDPDAKRCELAYTVVKQRGNLALVDIDLKTGRYHQIRAQCAAEGFPILGDTKYGGALYCGQGIALHHKRLIFPHPITCAIVEVESAEPFFL